VQRVRAVLTSDPKNDQDDDFLPDMLRERLQALWFTFQGARVPPTPAQTAELSALSAVEANASAEYANVMKSDVTSLNSALTAAGMKPIPPP
jgi:hypothetical protein